MVNVFLFRALKGCVEHFSCAPVTAATALQIPGVKASVRGLVQVVKL